MSALQPFSVVRVAIDGVDGAGKTIFADELAEILSSCQRQIIRISADDFSTPLSCAIAAAGTRPRASSRIPTTTPHSGEVLDPLGPGGSRRFRRRAFNLHQDRPVDAVAEFADSNAIVLLDGLFLHRDELWRTWDCSVFLDVEFEVSLTRCTQRATAWASPDPEAASNRRYVEGQRIYLSHCDPWSRATYVVDNNDLRAPLLRG